MQKRKRSRVDLQAQNLITGFTIVEMMVAVALFSMVVLMSVASLMSLINASQRTRSVRTTMDNLHLVVDSMSRDLRLGSKYYCSVYNNSPASLPPGGINTQDCTYAGGSGGQYLAFRDRYGKVRTYRFSGGRLQQNVTNQNWQDGFADNFANHVYLTPPDITIDEFNFYVYNTGPSSNAQPYIVLSIKGTAGSGQAASTFSIMTSISQRIPHNAE